MLDRAELAQKLMIIFLWQHKQTLKSPLIGFRHGSLHPQIESKSVTNTAGSRPQHNAETTLDKQTNTFYKIRAQGDYLLNHVYKN